MINIDHITEVKDIEPAFRQVVKTNPVVAQAMHVGMANIGKMNTADTLMLAIIALHVVNAGQSDQLIEYYHENVIPIRTADQLRKVKLHAPD